MEFTCLFPHFFSELKNGVVDFFVGQFFFFEVHKKCQGGVSTPYQHLTWVKGLNRIVGNSSLNASPSKLDKNS